MKNPIKQGLANGKIAITTFGDTIMIHSTDPVSMAIVQKDIDKALNQGRSLDLPNGGKQFIIFDAIHDADTDTYIWDKSGNRVKHNKVLHTVLKDGTHTQKIIGTTYRNF